GGLFLFSGAKPNTTSRILAWESTMDIGRPTELRLLRLRPGPYLHDTLPDEMLDHIGSIYGLIGPYLGLHQEAFEVTFLRAAVPTDEIAVWCNIAIAWDNYHDQFTDGEFLADHDERKLVAALVAIS